MAAFTDQFLYRITGKQSVERLDPLVSRVVSNCCAWDKDTHTNRQLDFVWETTCEKDLRERHNSAKVINKLHNSQIIESKSSLAYLQLLVDYPMLDTKVAYSSAEVEGWAKRRWYSASNTQCETEDRDWWVVKASKGNGGRDVWVFNKSNHEKVISELPPNEEYVIQRYVNNPLLFRGKKFHFRCYSVMTAGGAALVYRNAFILSAGLDFDYKDDDMRKHVTNLSVNKRFAGHPGQVPCNLQNEYPEVFGVQTVVSIEIVENYPFLILILLQVYVEIKRMWTAVVKAAMPYMQEQGSARHFEFFGIDIIADTAGQCWLVEANRCVNEVASAYLP